ncbi:hypothetical protein [Microbacterium sp. NPDC096154]|uniref:hypothetical protein n=1 Tax=Microbacterium sp. NPDC096154 TaxID=3155549 RepID=UPI0033184853
MTAPVLAYLHNGTFSQLTTFRDPALAPYRIREVYLPDMQPGDLDDVDGLIVADRIHSGLLRRHAEDILRVAHRGGVLVVFGENWVHTWMPDVVWEPGVTNFWWWRTGEDHGMRPRNLQDPAWEFFSEGSLIWHHHGTLTPPAGAVPLVAVEEDGVDIGCIAYVDRVSTAGEILVTTPDPCFHHGAAFMKGATQLLYSAVRWVDHRTRALAAVQA